MKKPGSKVILLNRFPFFVIYGNFGSLRNHQKKSPWCKITKFGGWDDPIFPSIAAKNCAGIPPLVRKVPERGARASQSFLASMVPSLGVPVTPLQVRGCPRCRCPPSLERPRTKAGSTPTLCPPQGSMAWCMLAPCTPAMGNNPSCYAQD
ncbi:hypothetical protein PIB30_071751 [Stylosanthes scabra]|uniref:Uncharacterized protein n=1 Tax=Stylosanthes scabra TaxID=79078 RepID=A0ABU6RPR5_9FABA|nr:hypothetical protein [Stylosanthes scabra]